MNYKCIIFDCDGILVDSEEISNRVLIEMAKEVGVNLRLEEILRDFAGKSLKWMFDQIQERTTTSLPADFVHDYRKRTFEAFETEIKPISGVREVLEKLDTPFCVASSGPVNKINLNLSTTGLIHFFENRIFSSYEIGSWKPNPEIFEYAAKQMGFLPEECVVIEDSLAGIQAAKTGGFDVYGLANEKNQSELEAAGAHVFFNMIDLIHLLDI